MATKKRRSDEGGSGAENKGRVAPPEESYELEGPHGDTDIDRDLDELEREGLMSGEGDRRSEKIASNPDNEEEAAEEVLEASTEDEDEAGHHRHRG